MPESPRKDQAWVEEKISHDVRKRGVPPERALASLKDLIRYSFQYRDDDAYTPGVVADVRRLKDDAGYKLYAWRNLWTEPAALCKGIASVWFVPEEKHLFEMLFHTPASFAAREETFWAYERLRELNVPGNEARNLLKYQRDAVAQVSEPPGATGLVLPSFVPPEPPAGSVPGPAAYYAVVDDHSTPDEPGGVVRRVDDGTTSLDEEFGTDLEWTPTWILYSWERGNMDRELRQVSEDEASQVIDRIRGTAAGA